MNMFRLIVLLLGISFTLTAKGQSGAFLEVSPDPRSEALGGVGLATSADAWSIYWNGAKSVFSKKNVNVAYSYTPWMKDVMKESQFNNISGYIKLTDKFSVLAAYTHFKNGVFDLYDDEGVVIGVTHPQEQAIALGFGYKVTENISFSLGAKYIESNMGDLLVGGGKADAVAFDFGIYSERVVDVNDKEAKIAMAVAVNNIGSKLQYHELGYRLPSSVGFGLSGELFFTKNLSVGVATDIAYRMAPKNEEALKLGIGAECTLYRFLTLRAGYHIADQTVGENDYFGVGGGIKIWKFYGDFSYRMSSEEQDPLDKTYKLAVGFKLGK